MTQFIQSFILHFGLAFKMMKLVAIVRLSFALCWHFFFGMLNIVCNNNGWRSISNKVRVAGYLRKLMAHNCQQVDTLQMLWYGRAFADFDKYIRKFRQRNMLCDEVRRFNEQDMLSYGRCQRMAMLMTTYIERISCWYDSQSLYRFDDACIRGYVITWIIVIHFENSDGKGVYHLLNTNIQIWTL